jgi:hypothetical protein
MGTVVVEPGVKEELNAPALPIISSIVGNLKRPFAVLRVTRWALVMSLKVSGNLL